MTTSPERPEAIVNRFNEGQTSGYTAVYDEIKKAQAENGNFWKDYGQQINDAVDTSAFTGGRDIQIVGLNSRNELLTTEDGLTIQRRRANDPSAVVGEFATPAEGEVWGNQGRKFQTDAAGQATYTIKKGDYLDHIVRDVLTNRDGVAPNQQDILKARQEIARANNITNVNRIPIGTTLNIPESLRTPTPGSDLPLPAGEVAPPAGSLLPPGSKGLTMDASHPANDGGYYSLFAPPGVADVTSPGESTFTGAYIEGGRENMQTIPGANGRDIKSYNAVLAGGFWGTLRGTNEAEVKDEVNRNTGILDKRTVEYPTGGSGGEVSFSVRTPDGGSADLVDVRKVEITRDSYGRYTSIYTLGSGSKYRGVSTPDGAPLYWNHM